MDLGATSLHARQPACRPLPLAGHLRCLPLAGRSRCLARERRHETLPFQVIGVGPWCWMPGGRVADPINA